MQARQGYRGRRPRGSVTGPVWGLRGKPERDIDTIRACACPFRTMPGERNSMEEKTSSPRSYWERRFHMATGAEAVGIPSLDDTYNRWMHRARVRCFRDAASRLPVEWGTAEVLDLGSGIGTILGAWRALGVRRIVAADFAETSLNHLRTEFPRIEALQFDLGGQVPFPVRDQFDAISAIDVMYHIVDDASYFRALETISSLVRPGGFSSSPRVCSSATGKRRST
jgi:SAM-dependent methyltransferase